MGLVVRLSGCREARRGASSRSRRSGPAPCSLTLRDRAALQAWSDVGRRAEICSTDLGTFALLYDAGRSWASRGVVRQSDGVLLWDCVTFADMGRFATVTEALNATGPTRQPPPSNVHPFRRPIEHCA